MYEYSAVYFKKSMTYSSSVLISCSVQGPAFLFWWYISLHNLANRCSDMSGKTLTIFWNNLVYSPRWLLEKISLTWSNVIPSRYHIKKKRWITHSRLYFFFFLFFYLLCKSFSLVFPTLIYQNNQIFSVWAMDPFLYYVQHLNSVAM